MFKITEDRVRHVVHVVIRDLWTVETVDRYATALGPVVGAWMASGKRFGLLVDARDYPVQTAATSERFGNMLKHMPMPGQTGLVGAAIVIGSVLNKLQAQRTFGSAAQIFADRDGALAWLTGEIGRTAD